MEPNDVKSILIIQSNQRNLDLLCHFVNQQGYNCIPLLQIDQLDETLEKLPGIHLALIDISGYDHSVWDCCELIRQKEIHLLIISAKQNISLQRDSLKYGASGVLVKPLVMYELSLLIKGLLDT